jgi:membrane fusion protein (multidrug efflux system)
MTRQINTDLLDNSHEASADTMVADEFAGEEKPEQTPAVPAGRKLPRPLILILLALSVAGSILWWLHSQGYEETDDAQIEGHLDLISPRITGTVTYINPQVQNNQFVQAGTLLLELDPRDYQADLEHAQANLDARGAEADSARITVPITNASAYSQLHAAEAAREQAVANVNSAVANVTATQHKLQQDELLYERAERDRVRYQALVEKHEISRSQYDTRDTEAAAAAQAVERDRAEVAATQQQLVAARSLVTQRQAQIESARTAPQQVSDAHARWQSAAGRAEQATAALHTAQLNLSYTKIYAPVSGVIGRKTVELGHRVQPGQSLLVIVPLDDIWVTANFKETQLKHMNPGQQVSIHVDTFERTFKGKVENMPGAAGPLFSLFPPENATGNYVKVVQRFPVRIRLDPGQDPQHLLRPGMSVEPTVSLR